jgi:serine/threonine-protein kinase HipA
MSIPIIQNCPGTLAIGFNTYSRTCLNRVFNGSKVSHVLPYASILGNEMEQALFVDNTLRISISGVQEKFAIIQEKNKLRLTTQGEKGTHILKPIPSVSKNADQLPANEHLTMQIARQVYGIETAENAIIFFGNGEAAYITKRFDIREDGGKWAQDDFASLAGKTPQTHGADYKYQGNYLQLFEIMQQYLPAYKLESLKLYQLLIFNYLFSNGDAHLKNFSVIETPLGDYKLSPAYDLLNSHIHVEDKEFGLDQGLLPVSLSQGKISNQFRLLAHHAGIPETIANSIMEQMLSKTEKVEAFIKASFLNDRIKRNYLQAYQGRWKKLGG